MVRTAPARPKGTAVWSPRFLGGSYKLTHGVSLDDLRHVLGDVIARRSAAQLVCLYAWASSTLWRSAQRRTKWVGRIYVLRTGKTVG